MTELIIMRGLPGSGKSTWAKTWVIRNPDERARVNRDDLRLMMHNRLWSETTERQIVEARNSSTIALLRANISVVVDETFLKDADVIAFVNMMKSETHWQLLDRGLHVSIEDKRTVPLDTCLRHNSQRFGGPEYIAPVVIKEMYDHQIAPYLTPDGRILEQRIRIDEPMTIAQRSDE